MGNLFGRVNARNIDLVIEGQSRGQVTRDFGVSNSSIDTRVKEDSRRICSLIKPMKSGKNTWFYKIVLNQLNSWLSSNFWLDW